MGVGQWKVFRQARKNLGTGALNLTGAWRIGLVRPRTPGGSVVFTGTPMYNTWGSINSREVANGNGYATGGKALSAEAWTGATDVNSLTLKYDASNVIWTASAGNITSIMGAVVFQSAATPGDGKLLCWCSLSSAAFDLAMNNTLTVQMHTDGIFRLY